MKAGLRPVAAIERYRAVGGYVTGFALLEIGRASAPPANPDLTKFPMLAKSVSAMKAADSERAFEPGLALLLSDLPR